MGCIAAIPETSQTADIEYNRLCKHTKQLLSPVKFMNTDKSCFYTDLKGGLWKLRRHNNQKENLELYYNNMRAFLLPTSDYILKPASVHKLTKRAFAIRMEFGGIDLFDAMQHSFSLKTVTGALRDVAEAIHWLHRHSLAHRDIKPENVVCHHGRYKLIDFDFCSPLEDFTHCGTEGFMCPPDGTKHWPGTPSDHSRRADVYAFGKTILMVLWKASSEGFLKRRRVIWLMFHKAYVAKIPMTIEPEWQPWLDIAMACCAKIPPTTIPTLPATMEDTVGTVDSGTAATTIQVVDADPGFA